MLQAAQLQCARPPSHGPRTLARCFCAFVLPGASSKPNLPAIKIHNKIRRRETKPQTASSLDPLTVSHSLRQPWLFSLTTALLLRAAAFYVSLRLGPGLILYHYTPQRKTSTSTSTSPSRPTIHDRRLLTARWNKSETWYESRDLIVSPRLYGTRLSRFRLPTK